MSLWITWAFVEEVVKMRHVYAICCYIIIALLADIHYFYTHEQWTKDTIRKETFLCYLVDSTQTNVNVCQLSLYVPFHLFYWVSVGVFIGILIEFSIFLLFYSLMHERNCVKTNKNQLWRFWKYHWVIFCKVEFLKVMNSTWLLDI